MLKVLRSLFAVALVCISSTCRVAADECDAVAAELAARVAGVTIGRRSSVAIFVFHPSVKYASIGCLNNGKNRNLFVEVEGKYPNSSFFDFIGMAGPIVLGGAADRFREGAVRCQKSALNKLDEEVDLRYSGLSFQCSADKLSSSMVMQKQ
jgi:hypothetical protein